MPRVVLLCLLAAALSWAPAPAVRAEEDEWEHASFRSTLQVSLDAEEQFAEVERAWGAGRPNLAFDLLHRSLSGPLDEVVLVGSVEQKYRLYAGVKQATRDRLWALCTSDASGEALRLYRSLYDPLAALAFRQALATRDVHGLAVVARDYGATSWGDDALLALGDLFLEQGNPAEALVHWQELLRRWRWAVEPAIGWSALVAKVASAHLLWGHRADARREVLGRAVAVRLAAGLAGGVLGERELARAGARLAREWLASPVLVGGERVAMGRLVRRVDSGLDGVRASWSGDEWPGPAGGREPAGLRARVDAVGPAAWSAEFLEVRVQGDQPTLRAPDKQIAWGAPVVNMMDFGVFTGIVQPYHPVVSRGRVCVPNGVVGRSFDLASGAAAGTFADFAPAPNGGWTAEDGLIAVPQGLAACGRWLFAVQRSTQRTFVLRRGIGEGAAGPLGLGQPPQRASQLPRQAVAAYDLTHGLRRQWSTAEARDEESRAFYDAACFHGPPAADEHSVYVGAYVLENDVKAYLCSIDIATGRLNWKSFLCSEQLSSFASVNPRPGLAPCLVDGLAIWCSNQGAIGGFDVLTGEVRWLLQYPRRPAYRYGGNVDLAPGWSDNPPVVSERVLYVTPQDGEHLWVADARTGQPHDAHRRAIEGDAEYRWLVGAPGGEIYLLGSRAVAPRGGRGKSRAVGRVVRYDPREPGAPGVALDLPDEVTGRGRAFAGCLYVPTRKGLYLADFTRPRAPALLGPLIPWDDPEGVAREVLVLESMVLAVSAQGRIEAWPVKR